MADDDKLSTDDARPLFALPAPTARPCEGRCGRMLLAPGPVWCADCKIREESDRAARQELAAVRPALESIPPSFRWAVFDSPEIRDRVRLGDRAILPARGGLPYALGVTVIGPAGAGKTSLACAMLRAWCFDRSIPIGVRASGIFTSARMVARSLDQPFGIMLHAGIVLLDDLGAEVDTPTGRAAVTDLIVERGAWDRPTIVTTGLDRAALHARYGDGVSRRLFERTLVLNLDPRSAAR